MSWTTNSDGSTTCEGHGVTFVSGVETCPACDRATALAVDQRAIVPAPANEQAIEDEAWCRARRDELAALAKELRGKGTKSRVGYVTIAKLYEAALKYHRTAVEERSRRDEIQHEQWLAEQNALLAGAGVAH